MEYLRKRNRLNKENSLKFLCMSYPSNSFFVYIRLLLVIPATVRRCRFDEVWLKNIKRLSAREAFYAIKCNIETKSVCQWYAFERGTFEEEDFTQLIKNPIWVSLWNIILKMWSKLRVNRLKIISWSVIWTLRIPQSWTRQAIHSLRFSQWRENLKVSTKRFEYHLT